MNITKLLLAVLIALCTQASFAQDGGINRIDDAGKKQGTWIKKYDNGQVRYAGQFEDDVPVGTFFYYNELGSKSSEVTHLDATKSHAKFFHLNSAVMGEGDYKNQRKEGEWRFYDDQSVLSSVEFYKDGKIHGTVKVYYLNGNLAAEFEYVDGLKNGPFKEYFQEGGVKIEGTYRDNSFDSAYVQYHSPGAVMLKGEYRSAVKQGLWVRYAENGAVMVQQVYERGKIVKEKYEEGYNAEDIPIEVDDKDKIDEGKMMEEWYMKGPGQ